MSLADALGTNHTFGVRAQPKVEPAATHDVEMDDDLFGGDAHAAEALSPTREEDRESSAALDANDRGDSVERQRQHLEYAEDDGEPASLEQKIEAQVEIPDVPFPRSSDNKVWVIRLPNYLKLDARPFAPEIYTGPENEDDGGDAELFKERSLSIKLEVENTIRWRWVRAPNGEMVRQSNTRFIRWSDGSLSVQLGKELFDVTDNVANEPSTRAGGGGVTYLVSQHKRAEILQAEAPVAGQLSIRPVSMQSEAHRKLVRAVSQRHTKLARLKVDASLDGLQLRQTDSGRKRAAPRRPRDPDAPGRQSRRRRMARADVWSDDDMSEDAESDGDAGGAGGDGSPAKRGSVQQKKKKRRPGADDGDRADDYKTDDFVVADSSDEDEDGGSSKKKRRNRADDDVDDAPDELEQMEAQLERRQAERRKNKPPAPPKPPAAKPAPSVLPTKADTEGSEEMDVESEEEDDMPRTRKAAVGKRKVAFDDDDE